MTHIADFIRTLPASKAEVVQELDITERDFDKLREQAAEMGMPVAYSRSDRAYQVAAGQAQISPLEKAVIDQVRALDLDPDEVRTLLTQLQKPERARRSFDHFYDSKRTRIGVISDLHIGSKFFREDAFEAAVNRFNQSDIEGVYIPGDIIEGMSNRDGHIYELAQVGVSAQMDRAAELLRAFDKPLFYTTGNHDEWSKKKANQGHLVGPEMELRLGNGAQFLGEYTADIKLHPNVTVRLTHEGSSSYALSYSGQKRINALQGGTKPDVIFNGHIHKMLHMFYRGINYFESGTMQDQTPFMAMKGSPSHVGFWVADIQYNKKGVNKVATEMYPFY